MSAAPHLQDLSPEALRDQGRECLRAGNPAQAIDLFSQAIAKAPDDPETRLGLGIALQGTRCHADALVHLERAQQAAPENHLPFLHAALSHLALGHTEPALLAANQASTLAPRSPQAHSALGQALLASHEAARAEAAFTTALAYAPRSADLWVLCGVARYRQGNIAGANAANQEALRHKPDHKVAQDNLSALARAAAGQPAAPATPPASLPADRTPLRLSAWKPKDASAALGLAVEFLSKMPAFARLQFGEWSQVLFYQVARGHYLFAVDQDRRVRGFLGWALTEETLAHQWVESLAGLRNDQCLAGDCVIINAFAAETDETNDFIVGKMRELFADKRTLYFKRHYPDGRTRPARLSVNKFVKAHLARSLKTGL